MFDYKDVYIVPQYSEITSRKQVNTSLKIDKNLTLKVPVISANMDTVTDGTMALAMYKAGAIGAIHRFMSIEENVKEFNIVNSHGAKCFVSVGVNEELARFDALYEAGARYFIIDIAHGHSLMMKDMVSSIRKKYKEVPYIMGGNVATKNGVLSLFSWGCDAVKVGVGPGNVCLTKNVTGVTVPQFSAVKDSTPPPYEFFSNGLIDDITDDELTLMDIRISSAKRMPLIVADGGVTEIGDIAKALGAGAQLVMCGRLFAECKETPGPRINGQKVYRGMASREAMLTIKNENSNLPTPEGKSILLEGTGENISAEEVVKHIQGGLQSSMSYSNSKNINEFRVRCKFGYRR